MRSWIKKIVPFLSVVCFFLPPTIAFATGSGFVPSTGLWFSKTNFAPGEMVTIYSVVVNPDYPGLSGTVGFYDNNELIDKVVIKNLAHDAATQIKVAWTPDAGDHTVSVRFIEVYSLDSAGKQSPISPSAITVTAGAPLLINNSPVVPNTTVGETTSSTTTDTNNQVALGATKIAVTKNGNELSLGPAKSSPAVSSNTSAANSGGSTFSGALTGVEDLFQKNRDALQKAGAMVGTITSTAGKVESAYNQTQAAIEQGKTYYQKGVDIWQKCAPYLEKAKPLWLKISNNNEPKRIFILIGIVLVIYLVLRFRRRRYNEFYDR